MASSMRARVSVPMRWKRPLVKFETVMGETLAREATSRMVAWAGLASLLADPFDISLTPCSLQQKRSI